LGGNGLGHHIAYRAPEGLKIGAFRPEYAGKMSFYLTVVDNILRRTADQPSIGVIPYGPETGST
jgi:hypothetical protein